MGLRFHFYSRENHERPHIHVARGDYGAKFWQQPIALAVNFGFAEPELRNIQRLVEVNCDELIEAYIRFHGRR